MTEQQSIVDMEQQQAGEQSRLRARDAIRHRTGSDSEAAEGVLEYFGGFEATRELESNREAFAKRIQKIKENVYLSDGERLEAATKAANEARTRHEELAQELTQQVGERHRAVEKTLFHAPPGKADAFHRTVTDLAGVGDEELMRYAETAHLAGDELLLRAVRAHAGARGLDDLLVAATGMSGDPVVAAAYFERQKLKTEGAVDALAGVFAPQPVTEAQLRPSAAAVERERQARSLREADAKRVLSGGGIVDGVHPLKARRQVGRQRS